MSYASWRISFQDSEQAARSAYEDTERLWEQLQALAAQNKAMRDTAEKWKDATYSCGNMAKEILSLPDLATPILNKVRAEALRNAADNIENKFDFVGDEFIVGDYLRSKANAIEKGE